MGGPTGSGWTASGVPGRDDGGVLGFARCCGGGAEGDEGAVDGGGAARLPRGGPGCGGNPVLQISATHSEAVQWSPWRVGACWTGLCGARGRAKQSSMSHRCGVGHAKAQRSVASASASGPAVATSSTWGGSRVHVAGAAFSFGEPSGSGVTVPSAIAPRGVSARARHPGLMEPRGQRPRGALPAAAGTHAPPKARQRSRGVPWAAPLLVRMA